MNSELIPCKNSIVSEILRKCFEKKTLSKDEILLLLESKEDRFLFHVAFFLKEIYKKKTITYSRKIFINITNLCKDFCSYCTYRKEPYNRQAVMMYPNEILELAEKGKKYKCTEALIVSGERPEERYKEAKDWLRSLNFKSTAEYVSNISEKITKKTGLLPHSNLGNISKEEMKMLKDYNVSLGLMLESSTYRLREKGMAHEYAPSKDPGIRLETIENAGILKIPLTTGILIGIGENIEEIIDSILLIGNINSKFGHIQEVILQNFRPKTNTKMHNMPPPEDNLFLRLVAISRILLPTMNIQIPPNLSPLNYSSFIDAGINDWGGISPVTVDHVNPEFAWPDIKDIKKNTQSKNQILRARLPIYPEFIKKEFINPTLENYIDNLMDKDGLVKEEYLNEF
ncbi:MAG: 7,8-didemethyl-8-hydroxy-5-deazariboflavin synthase CofG [Nitrososphaerales archaeon]